MRFKRKKASNHMKILTIKKSAILILNLLFFTYLTPAEQKNDPGTVVQMSKDGNSITYFDALTKCIKYLNGDIACTMTINGDECEIFGFGAQNLFTLLEKKYQTQMENNKKAEAVSDNEKKS